MKQTKINIGLVLASIGTLFVLAVVPAYADNGSSSGSDDTSTSETSDSTNTSDNQTETEQTDQQSGDVNETEVHHKADMFRAMGLAKVKQARENHSTLKTEKRQKVCENIQNAVNHKLSAFDNHANSYLTRLNTVFTKVQAYQTANNLPVSNYNDLVAAATTAQNNATVAVDALNSLGTSIDCSSSDPGAMLSSVKQGAASARDALKAYRTALKDIVVALAQAQDSNSNSTSTEGN